MNMKNLLVQSNLTIRSSMKTLNKTSVKCLLVIDNNKKLLGTLTDGDIRKSLLKGSILTDKIEKIYNKNPTVFKENNFSKKEAKEIFLNEKFDLIPIIDKDGKLIDYLDWQNLVNEKQKNKRTKINVPVVIMAGGKGSRLEPFTSILPKPLIPVHGKPVIQHIIEKFTNEGIDDYYISINYKGHILKAYFKELDPGNKYKYVQEKKMLGTAGSLSLLENKFTTPFVVTNCDVIIKTPTKTIYDFHLYQKNDITLVASAMEYTIPYGTCELNEDGNLSTINEKPKYNFLINTGLYILNPDMLSLIPKNKFLHITELIEKAINKNKKVGVFPIDDDEWVDIGQWTEYKKTIDKLNLT
jgi:dTDP-glucose pyrophosphorylase